MRLILYIYILAFSIFSIWVVASGFWDKDPLWKITTDAALFLVTLLGLFFYSLNLRPIALVNTWKVISVIAIFVQAGVNLYDRKITLAGKDPLLNANELTSQAILAADLVTLFMILPALILNVVYAYF